MSTATESKPKSKNVYDLTTDFEIVTQLLEDAEAVGDEEFKEMLRATLEAIEGTIEQKLEALVKVRRNYEAEAEMYKAEKLRLEKKQQTATNNASRVTRYIEDALTRLGYDAKNKKKVSAGLFKLGFNRVAPSLRVVDVKKIPKEFKTIPDPIVDKRALLAHAKTLLKPEHINQDEIELKKIGVVIENGKQTLSIR